ncbi:MAG: hypothetical protein WBD09_10410 [Halobacteriota archaeon]
MATDIEKIIAKLRKAKNEDDLFHKVRKYEKVYIADIESAEKEEDKEAIKSSIGNLMTFYKRALEIATLDVTRDRIIACIRLWKSHAFRKDIEIEPITSFPRLIFPLKPQEPIPTITVPKREPKIFAKRAGLEVLKRYGEKIGGEEEISEKYREKIEKHGAIVSIPDLLISSHEMELLKGMRVYIKGSKEEYVAKHKDVTTEERYKSSLEENIIKGRKEEEIWRYIR